MIQRQRGMTLIELMISMVISLGLIAGISSLFLQMQKSNKMQRGISAMADESSYVQEVLQKELRNTGRLRSRTDTKGTNGRIFLDPPGNELGSVSATDYGWNLNLAQGEYIKGATDANNDRFVIRYQLMDRNDLSRTNTPSNGSSPCTQNILMDDTDDIAGAGTPAGDSSQVVQTVSVYFALEGNKLTCMAQRHKVDNAILPATPATTVQCIKNCATPGSTADFKPEAGAVPIEIIGNVVRLILTYGVDSDVTPDNAANYYVPAASVPAGRWKNVVSVRMTVVVRSEDQYIRDGTVAYTLDGVDYSPTDKHQLYKVFTTTIALRNQLL